MLTREFWRTNVVVADPRTWAWFGKFLPERGLLALYRATFFYGVTRMISWTLWAHLLAHPTDIPGTTGPGYPFDFSWTGPWWIAARSLPHVNPWIVLPTALALLGVVYWVMSMLWEPMGRAEARKRSRDAADESGGRSGEPEGGLRRRPRLGGGDDVGAEHHDRVEVEAAQERHRGDVVGDGIGFVHDAQLGERPVHRRLEHVTDERRAGDDGLGVADAVDAHAADASARRRARRGACSGCGAAGRRPCRAPCGATPRTR